MGGRDRPLEPITVTAGYLRLSHGYSDLTTVHGYGDLPDLMTWLSRRERTDRILVQFASMSRRERNVILDRLRDLGLARRRLSGEDRRALRRSGLRNRRHAALAFAVSTITAPVWLPATLGLRVLGRGRRRWLFDNCSWLGLSGSGPGGPDPGSDGPDSGDRSPRLGPNGGGSMAASLEIPRDSH